MPPKRFNFTLKGTPLAPLGSHSWASGFYTKWPFQQVQFRLKSIRFDRHLGG